MKNLEKVIDSIDNDEIVLVDSDLKLWALKIKKQRVKRWGIWNHQSLEKDSLSIYILYFIKNYNWYFIQKI
jgi:hypothetical protein